MRTLQAAPVFQDNMLVQRGKEIIVWGTAEPKARIEVSVGRAVRATVCEDNGCWKIAMPPMPAQETVPFSIRNKSTGEALNFKNVAVGEVWIAGGQSNMEFLMKFDADRYVELTRRENPQIRFYDTPHLAFDGDTNPVEHQGVWRIASPENLPSFSAVAYYFARQIQQSQNIPVGIVGCNWGGTSALTWIERNRIQRHPQLKKYWDEFIAEAEKTPKAEYEERYWSCKAACLAFDQKYGDQVLYGMSWPQQLEHMKRLQTLPPMPVGERDVNAPGRLYESMVREIAGFSARGVLWYQGEGDWMRAKDYKILFQAVAESWRDAWQDELPFLTVQLAPFYRWLGETGLEYPELRRQQELAAKDIPKVWMVSSSDCGMKWDIHPKRKKPLGERLALLARAKVYGEEISGEASECLCARADGQFIVLEFSAGGGDLTMLDPVQRDLTLCYHDQTAEAVNIRCSGHKIFVQNLRMDQVPQKVSFLREAYYECVIYNSAGIPLKPFEVEVQQ